MKLHEIIKQNENHETSLLIEKFFPYKKSLLVYYKNQFTSDPILMVTDVMNAVQYGKIIPAGEFYEAICAYLEVPYIIIDQLEDSFDEELFAQYETICFNSILLENL